MTEAHHLVAGEAVRRRTSESHDMYLKALFVLEEGREQPTLSAVAAFLSVSPPAALGGLRRLAAENLAVKNGRHFSLTTGGFRDASTLIRRLRLSELMLAGPLRVPLLQIHAPACRLEHVVDDMLESRLLDMLGRPDRCPHGLPIPYAPVRGSPGVPLSWLDVDRAAVVKGLPEWDVTALDVALAAGLRLDGSVVIRRRGPDALLLDDGTRSFTLPLSAALRTLVRPTSTR